MQIKKAKASAPLWEPKVGEVCEFLIVRTGDWVRCKIEAINRVGNYNVTAEVDGELRNYIAEPSQVREGKAPMSKKDQIVRLLKTNEGLKALAMASKFPDLGEHRDAITKGANAAKNPDFYRQIKQDPTELVAAGIYAVRARYLRD